MVAITGELGPIPERMLDLSRIEALRGIELEAGQLVLGARTTYTEIRRSTLCREHLPALVEAAATIGAAQIQNRGTIGGNLANASPAGDTLPILLAADAVILVGGQRGEREIAASDFFVDYRKTALAPDELILQVRFPLRAGARAPVPQGGHAARPGDLEGRDGARLARPAQRGLDATCASRSAPSPRPRSGPAATEAVLEGAQPTPEVADRAAETLAGELSPIDDVRSTADYRRAVSARILHRLLRDAGGW